MVIDGRKVDIHVGMGHADPLDPLRGADQAHQTDIVAAALLEHGKGVAGAAARGKHRVGHNDQTVLDILGELAVIDDGLVRLLVAVQSDMTDLGNGYELMKALDHSHARTEYRDDGELAAGDDPALHRADGGLDVHLLKRDVAGDFISHQK